MLTFMILGFIAVASAARLDGYNYQPAASGPVAQLGSSVAAFPSQGLLGNGGTFGSIGGSGLNAALSAAGQAIGGSLQKEYYTCLAPENEFYDADGAQRSLQLLKKKLRVVFVKTPENNGLADAALQLAKQASQDQTAIYVLSKQPDLLELANRIQQVKESSAQKPEVRFIKYRTPEDAANAQRSIQQQYNALGGSSHN